MFLITANFLVFINSCHLWVLFILDTERDFGALVVQNKAFLDKIPLGSDSPNVNFLLHTTKQLQIQTATSQCRCVHPDSFKALRRNGNNFILFSQQDPRTFCFSRDWQCREEMKESVSIRAAGVASFRPRGQIWYCIWGFPINYAQAIFREWFSCLAFVPPPLAIAGKLHG